MENSGHIFLSYRSVEADFALRLAADLKNAGVNLWMDRIDIRPGDDWIKALQDAVNNCVAMITVLSPEYITSKYCQREIARADRMGRPLFPVLLHTLPESEWPFEIERRQFIDFSGWRDEQVYRYCLNQLVSILREQFAAQISVVPTPETRYLNSLIAQLETSKGLIACMEFSGQSEKLDNGSPIRPKPVMAKTWSMHGRFALVADKPSNNRAKLIIPTPRQRIPLNSIYQAIEEHPRLVLTGPPDSGKTTTLHYLVLDAARTFQAAPRIAPLPLLLKLTSWESEKSLSEYIYAAWPLDSDPIKLLAKGRAALYLDGLNEISPEKVGELREWLHSDNAPQRVIITCRADEYNAKLDLGLPVVEALELDTTHIENFIAHYLEPEHAKNLLLRIFPPFSLNESTASPLYRIACNPFLLSALVILYQIAPDQELPQSLGLLINQLVAELWQQEHQRHPEETVSFEELEAALVDLAVAMVDAGSHPYVPLEHAMEYLGSQALLQTGIGAYLVEVEGENVRFAHEQMKAYFAALGLAQLGLPTKLARPHFDDDIARISTQWDQPVALLAGMQPNPDALIAAIAEVDPYLSLQIITNGVRVAENVYQQTINAILTTMRQEGDWRVALARIMIAADTQIASSILLETLRDGSWNVRLAAASTLRQIEVPPLSGLTQALADFSDEMRETTAIALNQLSKTALPTLLQLLYDENRRIRRGAAWALGELKDKAAVPALVDALYDTDNLVSMEAANALGRIRDSETIPWLLDMLRHESWRVRKAASSALGRLGKPALTSLLKVLDSSDNTARRHAIEALARIRDESAITAIIAATYDENVEVRSAAVEGLRPLEGAAVTKRLLECLSDTARSRWSKQRICDTAASILEETGIEEAKIAVETWRKKNSTNKSGSEGRERLIQVQNGGRPTHQTQAEYLVALNDESWVVRRNAVLALAALAPDTATPYLLKALHDEDSQVRVSAAQTLALIKNDQALQGLIQALADPDYLVCDTATEALKKLAVPPVPALLELLYSPNINVRGAAIEVLGAIQDTSAVVDLEACLSDLSRPWLSDQRICDMAAQALETIGTQAALQAVQQWREPIYSRTIVQVAESDIEKQSESENNQKQGEQLRDSTHDTLLKLLDALHQEDWNARQDAAKSLREYARNMRGKQNSAGIVQLTQVLSDPDWVVRWASAEALAWMGDSLALTALIDQIHDSNWMVRVAVIRALAEIGDNQAIPAIGAMLLDSNNMVREAAAEALGRFKNSQAIQELQKAALDAEEFVRLAAIESFGRIQHVEATQTLLAALNDQSNLIRWAAVDALGKIGDASAVPALITSLDDLGGPDWEEKRICDVAAEALDYIATPEARLAVAQWRLRQNPGETTANL